MPKGKGGKSKVVLPREVNVNKTRLHLETEVRVIHYTVFPEFWSEKINNK